MKFLFPTLSLSLAFAVVSCKQISPDVYSHRTAGYAAETYAGVIQSARPVAVQGEGQLGTVLGAVAGGVGGAQLGGGTAVPIVGGIAGAAIGGMAGRGAEKALTKKQAMEYVVKTEDGHLHTIVQGVEPVLQPGQPVYVQLHGPGRSRVVPRS
jgi:outer membrane lipoprotein SlyB